MSGRVHAELGITAPSAGGDLSFEWRRGGHPLKSFAAIDRVPNPARVCCRRARYAGVKFNWDRRVHRVDAWVEAQVLFVTKSTDAADDRMTKCGRVRAKRHVDIRVLANILLLG